MALKKKVAGPHLHALDPFVFGKMQREDYVLIFHLPASRDWARPGHLEHCIGLADVPAIGPLPRRRRILRNAGWRACIRPFRNRPDLSARKRRVVREVTVLRIGEPGRHLARHCSLANRLGPGPRLGVSAKRHGRDLARPVALLAMVLENGQNIPIERRWSSGRRCERSRANGEPVKPRTYSGTPWNRNRRSRLRLFP